jgi:2-keto-4-pentenoate hydratase/2-oxohepta-3-ene-1,7-dioic acid hydratase in catechol pathway
MKLVSFRAGSGAAHVGVVADARVVDVEDQVARLPVPAHVAQRLATHGLAPATGGMLRLLQVGPEAWRQLSVATAGGTPLAEVQLLAPVPRPGKIVAVGRNYADHAKETGVQPFEAPRIISKLPSSVCAPGSRVLRPQAVTKLDFEVELAVVMGSFAQCVEAGGALAHVAGYTVLDDLSAREFQFDITPAQTTFAKSMDGFCPMGPWLVTRDEIADPQALELHCHVNGQRMQHGSTADMLFPVARLIAYISSFMTLEPGDVIATGTPAGIGAFRNPPVWLQPGDHIRMDISRIGVLEHSIADGASLPARQPETP